MQIYTQFGNTGFITAAKIIFPTVHPHLLRFEGQYVVAKSIQALVAKRSEFQSRTST